MIGSIEWYECFCGELCPFWRGFCEAAKSGVKLTEELSEADENDEPLVGSTVHNSRLESTMVNLSSSFHST